MSGRKGLVIPDTSEIIRCQRAHPSAMTLPNEFLCKELLNLNPAGENVHMFYSLFSAGFSPSFPAAVAKTRFLAPPFLFSANQRPRFQNKGFLRPIRAMHYVAGKNTLVTLQTFCDWIITFNSKRLN